jgi:hypothetical protein
MPYSWALIAPIFKTSTSAALIWQGFASRVKIFTKKTHLPLAISGKRYN